MINNNDNDILNKAIKTASSREETEKRKKEEAESKIEKLLSLIPEPEGSDINLRTEEKNRVLLLKEKGFSPEEIVEFVKNDVNLIKLSYQDRRPCFKEPLFNRKYIEFELAKKVGSAFEKKELSKPDLEKIAIINFDLNGLKALNDLGGHTSGDRGLGILAEILQNGETIKWLKENGVDSIPFTQGGDEFGALLSSDEKNLNEIRNEVERRFFEEVKSNKEATGLIDFESGLVQERLKDKELDIPKDFKFKLGTSVGMATIWDALQDAEFNENDDFFTRVRKIRGNMIGTADRKAMRHKEETKRKLKESELPEENSLYKLYTRLTPPDPEFLEFKKQLSENDLQTYLDIKNSNEINTIKKLYDKIKK